MTPNLFHFATKELSQDAFIAWLIQWAAPACAAIDIELHRCGTAFVRSLLSLEPAIPAPDTIMQIKVGRQWEGIDVWAEINDSHLLIIEDKTSTGQHSDQLRRYQRSASKWCEQHHRSLVCVYLKTGSECASSLDAVRSQGYHVHGRHDLLELLSGCQSSNAIFTDFVAHLRALEHAESGYLAKPSGMWTGDDWKGFFQALEKVRPVINWSYVNNPSGGFWNSVLNWFDYDDHCPYMQIEQGKLCFKVGEVAENRREVRERFHAWIANGFNDMPEVRRPERFGSGTYMTVAVVEPQHWLGTDTDTVDMRAVVARLGRYEGRLRAMVEARAES